MDPSSNKDDNGEDNVSDEEPFVCRCSEYRDDQHDRASYSGYTSPYPVFFLELFRVGTDIDVLREFSDGVNDDLDSEKSGDPSVEQDVGRVGPVCHPQ